MRYLLTLMVVLALAAPAWSACSTTDKVLAVARDCDLPDSTDEYSTWDCNEFDWEFEFYRTGKKGSSIMYVSIEGTDISTSFNSSDYTQRFHSFEGTGTVNSSHNRLRIAGNGLACNYFIDLKLRASNYR